MSEPTPNANMTLLSPAEIEYACQVMLSINGAAGLYTTPERQPLLLAEIASWLLSAAIFLTLRDNYKSPRDRQVSDVDLDAAIGDMKAFIPQRADALLASIAIGRSPAPSTQGVTMAA